MVARLIHCLLYCINKAKENNISDVLQGVYNIVWFLPRLDGYHCQPVFTRPGGGMEALLPGPEETLPPIRQRILQFGEFWVKNMVKNLSP